MTEIDSLPGKMGMSVFIIYITRLPTNSYIASTYPSSDIVMNKAAKPPLESILNSYDFEKVASQELSKKTWAFYSSAATDMITRDANKSMLDRILLRPRVLRNVTTVDTRTEILGCQSGLPLFVSPAAMAKMVHPEGELAMARGCAKYGVGQCVSIYS